MKKCSICKQDITPEPNGWAGGCNAWPINDGICCKACDDEVVLPARIAQYYAEVKEQKKEKTDEEMDSI